MYNYYGTTPTSCALPSAGTTNNGNVMGYWYQDSVNSNFSHTATYTYDGVNRLLTAVATPSGSGTVSYNLNFNNYDRYGNMTCVQNANTNGPCPQWAYNPSTNQLTTSGFTYDAAGNLTADVSNPTHHTYQWDAEGRVASVDSGSTWSFTYNALAERVQMATPSGTQELMYDPNGVWLGIYGVLDTLPWGGGFFAWYNGTDTYFHHINNLSSTSMLTNHAGTGVEDMLFYPWGDVWKSWGVGGYNFAEMPYYDPVTNTSLTPFRLQSPGLGRWLSPDPLGGDVTNPQTLNRYAYALNNPTSFTDPLGLQPGGCDSLSDPDCPCDPSDPTCIPPPLPCNPEVDPWDCQWQPPPTGGGGGAGGGGTGGGGQAGSGPPPQAHPPLGCEILRDGTVWCPPGSSPWSWIIAAGLGGGAAGTYLFEVQSSAQVPQNPEPQQPPSCVGLFFSEAFNNTLNNIVPFPPSAAGIAGAAASSVYARSTFNQALKYAASRLNYLGGQGLIYPLRSGVYRGMLRAAGRGASVGLLVTLDISMVQALATEWEAAKAGQCQ